jgi:hypothetical protein
MVRLHSIGHVPAFGHVPAIGIQVQVQQAIRQLAFQNPGGFVPMPDKFGNQGQVNRLAIYGEFQEILRGSVVQPNNPAHKTATDVRKACALNTLGI